MQKKISIPAYYRDKEGREKITASLEERISQIMSAVLEGGTNNGLNQKVCDLFSIEFDPKFMDDTRFVVVSRYHVAITAIQIWQMKYCTRAECEIIYPETRDKVEKFIERVYIPYCRKLQKNFFDKYSNHGALGLMGESIAIKYMIHYQININAQPHYKIQMSNCVKKLNKRVKKAVLHKDGWFGDRGEFWVENLRNKKGLFYTYLHLSALVRVMVTLMNEGEKPSEETLETLHLAYQQYLSYFYDPESWPYLDRTKIPLLRQLQGLIFPADKFIFPRFDGKEGAFMDVCANTVYPVTSPPFDSPHRFENLGPFPYSTHIQDSPHALWELL